MKIECRSFFHKRVPDSWPFIPCDPDFVAEIAGVTCAGNVDTNARDRRPSDLKVREAEDLPGVDDVLQESGGCWTLHSERCQSFRNVLDPNVHSDGILMEPSQARVRCRPSVL